MAETRFTTDALVIKETDIGEHDRLVTLMTRDRGVIRAFAAGAKNIKSRKRSATGLLSYSAFSVSKKGDTYRIYEAVPHTVFFGVGSDVVSLALSQYFCELCLVMGPDDSKDSEEFLRLILNSLHFISTDKKPIELIKAITELRIAAISGYMPNLIACNGCGKFEDDVMFFRYKDGHLLCKECDTGDVCAIIDKTMLDAMRHIVFSKFNSLYSFEIPIESAKKLSSVTERYIRVQTEHNFSTLEFFNSIKQE